MSTHQELQNRVSALDKKGYGAYQSLLGAYAYPDFRLIIEQIPKDPYAPAHIGVFRIQVERNDQKIVDCPLESKTAEIAFRDFLTRLFDNACRRISKGRRGTGNSGVITISQPSQAILERSCAVMNETTLEIRCFLGLPASGRTIDAQTAATMLFDELPEIVRNALYVENIDIEEMTRHVHAAVDADYLRSQLRLAGLVAFVADDAILPRKSGVSDKPWEINPVSFKSPESMRVDFMLPYAGKVSGMGIREGVTLIVGGGYHGKSTLLEAIEAGIYNHIPDDGRELCVADGDAVKVRAFSGRSIEQVDISLFIRNLPFAKDTTAFSTENASGSTSQAAGIIESLEVGAKVLLMDEDTCATNFMIRDRKMQDLVSKPDEPITPFIDRVRQLYRDQSVSTILVLGGVGDYFDVSDSVIQMNCYQAIDVTKRAHEIATSSSSSRTVEGDGLSAPPRQRMPLSGSISPLNAYGKKSIFAREIFRFVFGQNTVDLSDVEQLIELTQTKTIARALDYARRYMDGNTTLNDVMGQVIQDIDDTGLDILDSRISGEFAQVRRFELAFALNRLRGLKVRQVP